MQTKTIRLNIVFLLIITIALTAGMVGCTSEDEKAVDEAMVTLLDKNKEDWARKRAAGILGNSKSERVIHPLTIALNNSKWEIRMAAADALAATGLEKAGPPLMNALHDDPSSDVRGRAAFGIADLKLKHAGATLVNVLKDDKDPNVRASAAAALANLEYKDAVTPLCKALKDKEPTVCEYAAKALAFMGDPKANSALTEALSHENEDVRIAAMDTLGTLKAEIAVAKINAILNNKYLKEDIRTKAIVALGKIGDTRAVTPLGEIYKNKENSTDLRKEAIKALGLFNKDDAAKKILTTASKDEISTLRYAAQAALK